MARPGTLVALNLWRRERRVGRCWGEVSKWGKVKQIYTGKIFVKYLQNIGDGNGESGATGGRSPGKVRLSNFIFVKYWWNIGEGNGELGAAGEVWKWGKVKKYCLGRRSVGKIKSNRSTEEGYSEVGTFGITVNCVKVSCLWSNPKWFTWRGDQARDTCWRQGGTRRLPTTIAATRKF